jgi:hypothetical protein
MAKRKRAASVSPTTERRALITALQTREVTFANGAQVSKWKLNGQRYKRRKVTVRVISPRLHAKLLDLMVFISAVCALSLTLFVHALSGLKRHRPVEEVRPLRNRLYPRMAQRPAG